MFLRFIYCLSLLILNALLVLGYEGSFHQFGITLKILLPFILFFYFRKYINTLLDLEGFLITFLIASVFPIATLYYEILFDPISQVYNIESRGGGLRFKWVLCRFIRLYEPPDMWVYLLLLFLRQEWVTRGKNILFLLDLGFLVVLLICLIGIFRR